MSDQNFVAPDQFPMPPVIKKQIDEKYFLCSEDRQSYHELAAHLITIIKPIDMEDWLYALDIIESHWNDLAVRKLMRLWRESALRNALRTLLVEQGMQHPKYLEEFTQQYFASGEKREMLLAFLRKYGLNEQHIQAQVEKNLLERTQALQKATWASQARRERSWIFMDIRQQAKAAARGKVQQKPAPLLDSPPIQVENLSNDRENAPTTGVENTPPIQAETHPSIPAEISAFADRKNSTETPMEINRDTKPHGSP